MLCCVIAVGTIVGCKGKADRWGTDLEQGLVEAAKEERSVLVEFTGSDWCPACKQLRTRILNTHEFRSWAAEKKLVLVELDFPRDQSKVTPEQMEIREAVRNKYHVESYPTVMVLNRQGIPFGRVIGAPSTVGQLTGALDEVLALKKAYEQKMSEAEKLQGIERAKVMADALRLLPEESVVYCEEHTDIISIIAQDDPEDTLGVRRDAEHRKLVEKQKTAFVDAIGNIIRTVKPPKTIVALREETKRRLEEGKDLLPEVRQFMYQVLAGSYYQLMDKKGAIPYIEAAIRENPDSPEAERLRGILKATTEELEKGKAAPEKTDDANPTQEKSAAQSIDDPDH